MFFFFMQQVAQHQIAECRLKIDQCRLLTLFAAHMIDKFGAKRAMKQVYLFVVV